MLSKKLKVFLSLFVALTVMTSMCFATDDTATVTAESKENAQEAVVTNQNEETTGAEDTTPDSLVQPTVEPINGDLYKAEDTVEITDAINGNVFIAANTVTIKGQIAGDLFVVAKSVNIDGAQIYGNVFAVAQDLTLNGLIYDLYGACTTFNMPYNGTTYRDLKLVCNNATLDGVVGGTANITVAGNLAVDKDFMVYKDFNYTAQSEVEINSEAIQGEIHYTNIKEAKPATSKASNYVLPLIMILVFTLVVWLLANKLAPKFVEKATAVAKTRPVASLLYGLLTLVATPFVAIILCMTVVGIPVAIALMVLYGLVLCITTAITTIALADILAKKVSIFAKAKNLLAIVTVAVVLWALSLVPVLGGIVGFLVVLYGLGIVVLSVLNKANKSKKEEKKPVKVEKKEEIVKTEPVKEEKKAEKTVEKKPTKKTTTTKKTATKTTKKTDKK